MTLWKTRFILINTSVYSDVKHDLLFDWSERIGRFHYHATRSLLVFNVKLFSTLMNQTCWWVGQVNSSQVSIEILYKENIRTCDILKFCRRKNADCDRRYLCFFFFCFFFCFFSVRFYFVTPNEHQKQYFHEWRSHEWKYHFGVHFILHWKIQISVPFLLFTIIMHSSTG